MGLLFPLWWILRLQLQVQAVRNGAPANGQSETPAGGGMADDSSRLDSTEAKGIKRKLDLT